ncbi:RING finger domain protein [Penicillium waksmanii]|uniref:RING finger domain protein n=1 Tax=Penicillium waksmanii TaxID=69791 RepID=UPI0025486F78|nr:RING finger domain protein [Penicillium waksmanii]KAJ5975631.1 RING finger domain protein [Penicillium waksmanii]
MGIPKTLLPAQDDLSEPTSPKLPARSTKSSVTTRSRKAKNEDDLPYHPPSRKGKRRAVDQNPATESKSTGSTDPAVDVSPPPKKKAKTRAKKDKADGGAEKRKKPWLDEAPIEHKVKLMRLASKISRYLPLNPNLPLPIVSENPHISFDIIGSTGKLYKTTIKEVSFCDCPDSRYRRSMCKHIIYVLVRALKAPAELQYQQAFLPSELRSMLENASHSLRIDAPTGTAAEENNGTRKSIEGDCPVCFMEMTPDEKIVWCMATCGNNIHGECLKRWAAVSCDSGLRCVYCRSPWKTAKELATGLDLEDLCPQKKRLGPNRYVNLAEEYGIVPSPKKGAGGGGGKEVPGFSQ